MAAYQRKICGPMAEVWRSKTSYLFSWESGRELGYLTLTPWIRPFIRNVWWGNVWCKTWNNRDDKKRLIHCTTTYLLLIWPPTNSCSTVTLIFLEQTSYADHRSKTWGCRSLNTWSIKLVFFFRCTETQEHSQSLNQEIGKHLLTHTQFYTPHHNVHP